MTRHRRITPTKRQVADMLALGFEWRDYHQAFAWFEENKNPDFRGRSVNGWVFPPMHEQTRKSPGGNHWVPRRIVFSANPYPNGPSFPDPITAATWLLIESASV